LWFTRYSEKLKREPDSSDDIKSFTLDTIVTFCGKEDEYIFEKHSNITVLLAKNLIWEEALQIVLVH